MAGVHPGVALLMDLRNASEEDGVSLSDTHLQGNIAHLPLIARIAMVEGVTVIGIHFNVWKPLTLFYFGVFDKKFFYL
jgi:hypothetical protein